MIEKIKAAVSSPNLWISIGIVVAGVVVWLLIRRCFGILIKKAEEHHKKPMNIHYISAAVKYLLGIFVLITVLQINGINVASLITGLGIVSVIIGFAVQDLLKDLIMGTNIVSSGFFKTGDIVQYQNIEGKVEEFSVRATKLRDIKTGNLYSICNRNISEIQVLSDWLDLCIPAPYEEDADRLRSLCRELCNRIRARDKVTDCEFLGTDSFEDSYISYRLRIHCPPEYRHGIRREALGIVQDMYKEYGIQVPFPQIDVHMLPR